MALLQLRDRGQLSLDDQGKDHAVKDTPSKHILIVYFVVVTKYVPGYLPQSLGADSPPATLRHLLNMTAGLPQDDPWCRDALCASPPL